MILSSRTLQRKTSSRKFPQQILQPPPEIGPFCRSIPSPTPAAAAPWATCLRCPARPRPRHVGMAPPPGAWAPSGPSQRHHRDWRVWHLLVWRLGWERGREKVVCSWFDVFFFFEGWGGDKYLKVSKGSWTWSMFFLGEKIGSYMIYLEKERELDGIPKKVLKLKHHLSSIHFRWLCHNVLHHLNRVMRFWWNVV